MTCQGVPPTCVQCKDGYIINAVDNTMCGELEDYYNTQTHAAFGRARFATH